MEERTAQITLTESEAMQIMGGLWCQDSESNYYDAELEAMIVKWKQFIRDNFDPDFAKGK